MVGVLAANNTNDMCPECEHKLIRAYIDWMDWTQTNQPGLWAGYNSIVHSEGDGQKFISISFSLLFKGPQSDTVRALGVFDDLIDQYDGTIFWAQKIESNFDTFFGWHGPETDVVGGTSFMSARLITIDSFESDESKDALVDAIMAAKGGLFEHIMG